MEWWINSYSTQHSSPLKLIFHGIVWVWIESNLFSIVFLSSWFYNAVLSLSCSSLCLAEIKLNLIRVQYPFNISPSRAFTAICLFVYVKYAWFTSLLILLSNNIVIYKRIKRNSSKPQWRYWSFSASLSLHSLVFNPWRFSLYIFSPLVALIGALI